jgi:hypothetical protein
MSVRTAAALASLLGVFPLVSGCESAPQRDPVPTCHGPEDCKTNEFCRFEDGLCGQSSDGVCALRPERCDLNYSPVWGCNDQMYGNDCAAQLSGYDVSGSASEDEAKDRLFCDEALCDPETQYCRLWLGKAYKLGECRALPQSCAPSEVTDCACLLPAEPDYDSSCDECDFVDGLLGVACYE